MSDVWSRHIQLRRRCENVPTTNEEVTELRINLATLKARVDILTILTVATFGSIWITHML